MNGYVIITDSACDLGKDRLCEWGIPYSPLTFRFDGEERQLRDDEMPSAEFYGKMRMGGVAKTSAVNTEDFKGIFRAPLESGLDVLYVGFSSGLSTTYNSARIAAEQMRAEYPERKIITVDTLAASAGEGLILYLAKRKKDEGASIDEVAAFAEDIKLKISIWFTVDDLVYLKRGGRISAAAAFFGNMLGIKPVMHMDNEGHLVPVAKARGRRGAIEALSKKYGELCRDGENIAFISHADCEADAHRLADLIKEKYNAHTELITSVGPVIGAHAGPGTLALFFIGKER